MQGYRSCWSRTLWRFYSRIRMRKSRKATWVFWDHKTVTRHRIVLWICHNHRAILCFTIESALLRDDGNFMLVSTEQYICFYSVLASRKRFDLHYYLQEHIFISDYNRKHLICGSNGVVKKLNMLTYLLVFSGVPLLCAVC